MAHPNARASFVVGLRNAHALENEALSIMNRQLDRLENYPFLATRIRTHVTETEEQKARLEWMLHDLDEDTSTLKDLGATIMGNAAALGHTIADDEVLKNVFADFAFENYEIAAYRSLITMAEHGGFSSALPGLKTSLLQEEEMAEWLQQHIPEVTRTFLELDAAGLEASR